MRIVQVNHRDAYCGRKGVPVRKGKEPAFDVRIAGSVVGTGIPAQHTRRAKLWVIVAQSVWIRRGSARHRRLTLVRDAVAVAVVGAVCDTKEGPSWRMTENVNLAHVERIVTVAIILSAAVGKVRANAWVCVAINLAGVWHAISVAVRSRKALVGQPVRAAVARSRGAGRSSERGARRVPGFLTARAIWTKPVLYIIAHAIPDKCLRTPRPSVGHATVCFGGFHVGTAAAR